MIALRRWWRGLAFMAVLAALPVTAAQDYQLLPRKVAEDTYVLVGRTEDFSPANGGNIVNTGFIVTAEGVVVIDSGPSRRYGEQMRRAIATVTPRPVKRLYITHHHPDHFFGNQAYADVPTAALPRAMQGMEAEGGNFAGNLYRMAGDWMKGTEPLPAREAAAPGRFTLGGHELEILAFDGHTGADLVVFDHTSGVLFAGDLVFHQRAPTTPHADIARWLRALDALEALPFRLLVPGHGEPATDGRAIVQTRRYLLWLDATLRRAAAEGMDMPELLQQPLPPEFAGMALARPEFERSVAHLFRGLEAQSLGKAP